MVADFATGRAIPIGRKGSGPGEYRLPSRIIAWTGELVEANKFASMKAAITDSLLLNDGGNSRLAVIGPDLRIHRSFSLNIPNVPTTLAPRTVDTRGRLYLQVPLWAAESFGRRGDSVPVVRVTGGSVEVLTSGGVGRGGRCQGEKYGV